MNASAPEPGLPSTTAIAIGLVLAPVVWAMETNFAQTLAAHACFASDAPNASLQQPGTMAWLNATMVAALALCAFGCTVGVRNWRRTAALTQRIRAGHRAPRHATAVGFLARAGALSSGLFMVGMLGTAVALWIVSPCGASSLLTSSLTSNSARKPTSAPIAVSGSEAKAASGSASNSEPDSGAPTAHLSTFTSAAALTSSQSTPAKNVSTSDLNALIKRGEYVAKLGDCAGCHTASPRTDVNGSRISPPPFAGGLPINAPFGTMYSSNITPDPRYGIGAYSYEDFAHALRQGVARGGKRLYPAMPYPSFSKIDDDDMHALYAYFMHGVTPIATAAPETHLPFPFNQRWGLAIWTWLFAPTDGFEPDTRHDAQWNRGAYLVQSLGHCGACHTPRGPAYEERGYTGASPLYLSGGTNDHWFAPDLRATSLSGLGRIPDADVIGFLKFGHGGGLITFGSMVDVVEDSTQYYDDADLAAVVVYLKSLPASADEGRFAPRSHAATMSAQALRTGLIQRPGAGLYLSACARCHQADGQGVLGKYPALAGNPIVLAPDTQSIVRIVLEGGHSPQTNSGPASQKMPAFGSQFSDKEISRVLTLIRTTWGNAADPVTEADVRAMRSSLHR